MSTLGRHALTVDVEDWNEAFGREGLPERLSHSEPRVEFATDRVLDLLATRGARATFFVLATVARSFPDLVRRIAREGHQIGSHGWEHRRLDASTPQLLRVHLEDSRKLLQDLSGQPVLGFRAPWFSLTRATAWAEVSIQEAGFTYDSSIFPVWNPFYGQAQAPLGIHRLAGGPLEVPLAAAQAGPVRLPVAGGFYWRLLPYPLLRWGIDRVAGAGRPAVLYLHPWELDTEQPRVWMGLLDTVIHYLNISRTQGVLERVLKRWSCASIEEVFPEVVAGA